MLCQTCLRAEATDHVLHRLSDDPRVESRDCPAFCGREFTNSTTGRIRNAGRRPWRIPAPRNSRKVGAKVRRAAARKRPRGRRPTMHPRAAGPITPLSGHTPQFLTGVSREVYEGV
jgi:hypothetical protein